MVALKHGARRHAEGVDATHVGEHALAEVVDVVEGDPVVVGAALGVAPAPADRDAGVIKIIDIVVLDRALRGMADPHADRRGVEAAAVGDRAVGDRDPLHRSAGEVDRARRAPRLRAAAGADQDAAGTEVEQVAPLHRAVVAARPKLKGVAAHLLDSHAIKRNMPRGGRHHHAADVDLSLRKRLPLLSEIPAAVGEGQVFKADVLDPRAAGKIAANLHKPLQPRRDHVDGLRRLAWQRRVGQAATGPIEIPAAGLADRLRGILHEVEIALWKRAPGDRGAGVAGEADMEVLGVDLGNPHPRHRPAVHGKHLNVAASPARLDVFGMKAEAVVPFAGSLGRRLERFGDRIPAPLGQPRSKPPLAVDEQLRKPPAALGHLLQRRFPERAALGIAANLPAGDPRAAADQRPLAVVGEHSPDDGWGCRGS